MFILKFALELSVLAIFFLMIRKALLKTFPKLNPEFVERSKGRWHGQRILYSGLFLTFGVVSSVVAFWLIYGAFSLLHSLGNYSGVLVVSQAALVLPSMIIGFYVSTIFTMDLYTALFGSGDYIEFERVHGQRKGVGKTFARVFSALTLLPAIVLLSLQFNVYLKTDGERIYTKRMLEEEKIYSVAEIVSVGSSDSESLDIYLANGESISTLNYSGNINYFLDNISRR